VPHGHTAADDQRRGIVGHMEHGIVLDIGRLANADVVHVSPDHSVVPDAAAGSDFHIADDPGAVGDEYVIGNPRKLIAVGVDAC
jgi:hypothetical protein